MINFNEEIKKFKPILEISDIESASDKDEMADMLELLQYIAGKGEKSVNKEKYQ